MKKATLLLLALAMLLAAMPLAAGAEEAAEPYTYTMVMYNFGPLDENPVMVQYWNEKYGVNFEPINVEQSSAAEQINLMISAGEIPDVMQSIDANAYYQQGIIGGWSEEFFREHAPRLSAYIDETEPKSWAYAKYDGENMYSIPGFRLYNTVADPFIWRTDWLENLGITEIPETLEEVEEVFYRIAKEDPDGNGVDDTYALSETAFDAIYGAFGFQRNTWIEDGEGGVVFGDVMPQAKDALALLNKWYTDGVLDPEFITGENQGGYWAISHAFLNGRIGVSGMGSFYHWVDSTALGGTMVGRMAEAIKDAGVDIPYAPGHPPIGPDGDWGTTQASPVSLRTHFSSVLTADTERFARLLEIIDDMMMDLDNCTRASRGIPGETYEIVEWNGQQVINMLVENNTTAVNGMGAAAWFMFTEEYNYDFQYMAYAYDFAWYEEFMKDFNQGYISAIYGTLPSNAMYATECNKILNEGYIAIITGEQPLDYFDTMVEQWYNAGGTVLTEEANELYAQQNA